MASSATRRLVLGQQLLGLRLEHDPRDSDRGIAAGVRPLPPRRLRHRQDLAGTGHSPHESETQLGPDGPPTRVYLGARSWLPGGPWPEAGAMAPGFRPFDPAAVDPRRELRRLLRPCGGEPLGPSARRSTSSTAMKSAPGAILASISTTPRRCDRRFPVPYAVALSGSLLADWVNGRFFHDRARLPGLLIPCRFRARFKPLRFSTCKVEEVLGWRPPLDFAECLWRTYDAEPATVYP